MFGRLPALLMLLFAGGCAAGGAASSPTPYRDGRPYTRWWWFSGPIEEKDVRCQLDWLKRNGFGGVEIAWVYALPDSPPGPSWLSPEWSRVVAETKRYADSIGLGCDFTCGTLWPFGDSQVPEGDAARTFSGPSEQRIRRSWEHPAREPSLVLNHLDRGALERYAERVGGALRPALAGSPSALFCDSWEVHTEGLWTTGLDEEFRARFGYDLAPFKESLAAHPDVRYDYRALLAEVVIREFYKPFTEICHRLGARSRVQCLGAPTDLLAAYAEIDVPESEAVLFDPQVAQIAASAAALTRKTVVSAEAFTCLYGWQRWPGPSPHQKEEQVADLKLVADALFANGVNLIVWHGMPYNPPGGQNEFYASVHVGQDGALAPELLAFNRYLRQVSELMRRGKPWTDLAVYLPLEDAWMQDRLPEEQRRPSAEYHWEMQYQRFPAETVGYRPTWVSAAFLPAARCEGGALWIGEARFSALYVDVEWLDALALRHVLALAREGLPLCLKRTPSRPGHGEAKSYEEDLAALLALPNVKSRLAEVVAHPPLLEGADLPEFTCRVEGEQLVLFLAHPLSRTIGYPLRYGQSFAEAPQTVRLTLHHRGRSTPLVLTFEPYQSLCLQVAEDGSVTELPITLPCPAPRRESE
ncbi:MAG: hypothetical protein HY812_21265 [Planctomycetes bacterium]|nr:hypothetical protein [Planctomycetota bacterium]